MAVPGRGVVRMAGKQQRIFRTDKSEGSGNTFTRIDNRVLNDDRLSPLARLAMIYLLSKPDDWELREYDLRRYLEVGINKTRKIIAELKELGYLQRKQFRSEETGKWTTTTTAVYECPDLAVARLQCNRNGATVTVATDTVQPKPCSIVTTESQTTESLTTDFGTTERERRTLSENAQTENSCSRTGKVSMENEDTLPTEHEPLQKKISALEIYKKFTPSPNESMKMYCKYIDERIAEGIGDYELFRKSLFYVDAQANYSIFVIDDINQILKMLIEGRLE